MHIFYWKNGIYKNILRYISNQEGISWHTVLVSAAATTKVPRGCPSPRRGVENGKKQAETSGLG